MQQPSSAVQPCRPVAPSPYPWAPGVPLTPVPDLAPLAPGPIGILTSMSTSLRNTLTPAPATGVPLYPRPATPQPSSQIGLRLSIRPSPSRPPKLVPGAVSGLRSLGSSPWMMPLAHNTRLLLYLQVPTPPIHLLLSCFRATSPAHPHCLFFRLIVTPLPSRRLSYIPPRSIISSRAGSPPPTLS